MTADDADEFDLDVRVPAGQADSGLVPHTQCDAAECVGGPPATDTCFGGDTCEGTCAGETCDTCQGDTCEGTCVGNTCEGTCPGDGCGSPEVEVFTDVCLIRR